MVTNGSGPLPRLVLVRGPWLNKAELAPFELLGDAFDITAIGSPWAHADTHLDVEMRPCVGSLLDRVPKVRRAWKLALEHTAGDPYYIAGLRPLVRSADVIDVQEMYFGLSYQTARAIGSGGPKLIASVCENTPFYKDQNPKTRRLKRYVQDRAAGFIARTHQIKGAIEAEGIAPERIAVVYNGVDSELFAPAARSPELMRRFGLEDDDFVMLFAGKLVWEKGVNDLLRALAGVVRRAEARGDEGEARRLKFVILGEGKEERRLRRLAAELGVADRVVFAGTVPFGQMPAVHNLADVAVVASKPYPLGQEQEARVVREMMACARPMVATACGGNHELVGDAGLIVPPADHVAMIAALERLLDAPDERARLGAAARERALAEFDAPVVAARRRAVYESALAGRPVGAAYQSASS